MATETVTLKTASQIGIRLDLVGHRLITVAMAYTAIAAT